MNVKKIKLNNFRNYESQEIDFNEKANIFYGNNAQGKTNILEAVFISALGKSFRTRSEKELICFGEKEAKIELDFEKKDRNGKIEIIIQEDKKTIFVNGVKLKKISDLLGKINVVIFSPEHIEIIKGGPSQRRRFLDIMISQLKPTYVYDLNQYLKILEQRNILLRQLKKEKKEEELLEIWDEQLIETGRKIYETRRIFIEKIKQKSLEFHAKITDEKEKIEIFYQSQCQTKESFEKKLIENRKDDILRGYTSTGVHRDDFEIMINGKKVNIYGSQGQQRTAILTLKLAEMEVVYEEIGEYPILLLDDFMSELDEARRNRFLQDIQENQVLITCTDKTKTKGNLFFVEKGKVKLEKKKE